MFLFLMRFFLLFVLMGIEHDRLGIAFCVWCVISGCVSCACVLCLSDFLWSGCFMCFEASEWINLE